MLKKIVKKLKSLYDSLRYGATEADYNANEYWNDRHNKYKRDTLKGVGDASKSEIENRSEYESAKYIFQGILAELGLTAPQKVLELGYGIGFYTLLMDKMAKEYLGVDIVDIHVNPIKDKLQKPFEFLKKDIGVDEVIFSECDLVYMIDVSQHIVNDEKLAYALQNNIQKNLQPNGVFIVTDELNNQKFSYYEKSRNLAFYKNNLNQCELIKEPIQFRDKYIFVFKKTMNAS